MVTRQRLIEASIDLFSRHGFDGTSLSSIADRAGATQPTLNYHFGTKEQLYRDVISYCGSQWIGAIEIGDDLRDLVQLDVLRVVLRRLGHVIVGQKVVTRLMLQASLHPEFEAEVEEALRPGVDAVDGPPRRPDGHGITASGAAIRGHQHVRRRPHNQRRCGASEELGIRRRLLRPIGRQLPDRPPDRHPLERHPPPPARWRVIQPARNGAPGRLIMAALHRAAIALKEATGWRRTRNEAN